MISKGDLLCKKYSQTPYELCINVVYVQKVLVELDGNTSYNVANLVDHTTTLYAMGNKMPRGWFRLSHQGVKFTPLELCVITTVLTNTGITIEQLARRLVRYGNAALIKSAVTRIGKKGYTMINNYIGDS